MKNNLNFDQCWAAVQARDAGLDGQFVTAVRSTGIYCRPSCPARHPRRENVQFFGTPAEAEAAGFRACQRCHPEAAGAYPPPPPWVEQVCRWLETEENIPSLEDLSRKFHISPAHLQRTFKRRMGVSPRQYGEACRQKRLKNELREQATVTEALYAAGYQSPSSFYEQVDRHLGMAPAAYRKGGTDMSIDYTITSSPLGRVLVAATQRGICAVSLGDSDEELLQGLRHEFPGAETRRVDGALQSWTEVILSLLAGDQDAYQAAMDLPLDIRATAFQWQVWQALRQIPFGETRTYAEMAQALGSPKAVRAVARACATNRLALLIPCHRVVRTGGALGGYRWGLDRKRMLLDQETEPAQLKVKTGV